MLDAYTFGGKIAKGHTYTLITKTCGGQIAKGRNYTLDAYTCSGKIAKGRTYFYYPSEPLVPSLAP